MKALFTQVDIGQTSPFTGRIPFAFGVACQQQSAWGWFERLHLVRHVVIPKTDDILAGCRIYAAYGFFCVKGIVWGNDNVGQFVERHERDTLLAGALWQLVTAQ